MALILLGVLLAGIGSSALLVRLGVRSMPGRYALAIVTGYGVFLAGVRLWLGYARRALPHLEREVVEVGEGKRSASLPRDKGSWDGDGLADLASMGDVVGGAGDGCLVASVVTVVVAVFGLSAAYIFAAAPELLGEAVVQFALAAALRRKGKVWNGGHWSGSVFRATWWIGLIAVGAAVVLGLLAQAKCPAAATLFEAFSRCRGN